MGRSLTGKELAVDCLHTATTLSLPQRDFSLHPLQITHVRFTKFPSFALRSKTIVSVHYVS